MGIEAGTTGFTEIATKLISSQLLSSSHSQFGSLMLIEKIVSGPYLFSTVCAVEGVLLKWHFWVIWDLLKGFCLKYFSRPLSLKGLSHVAKVILY